MKIYTIETGSFKLDGGAMFGVVPKVIWSKLILPDNLNRIKLAMRCLLVKTENRLILFDTGIGNKQTGNFIQHFSPENTHLLLENLHNLSFSANDITDVILTHLHFDHVGGALCFDHDGKIVPTFKNATYWTNSNQWESALFPSIKESPSFLKENFLVLKELNILRFIPQTEDDYYFLPGICLRFIHGHTDSMMLPIITNQNRTFVYCADLIPTIHHLSLSYTIAFDISPLHTISEKQRVLDDAIAENQILIFEHDIENECVRLEKGDNGKLKLIPIQLNAYV